MTRSQVDEILAKLDLMNTRLNAQSTKIDHLTKEIERWRGGLAVLRALAGILGVGGLGAILAWMQSQAK